MIDTLTNLTLMTVSYACLRVFLGLLGQTQVLP